MFLGLFVDTWGSISLLCVCHVGSLGEMRRRDRSLRLCTAACALLRSDLSAVAETLAQKSKYSGRAVQPRWKPDPDARVFGITFILSSSRSSSTLHCIHIPAQTYTYTT